MSVFANEGAEETPVDLFSDLDQTFSAVMDLLAPEAPEPPAEGGAAAVPADARTAGQPAAPAQVPGGAAAPPAATAGGAAGQSEVPPAGAAPEGTPAGGEVGAGSAAGAVDFAAIQADFGKMSTQLEERSVQLHQGAALKEVQAQFPKYFDALRQHPRMLVGVKVPSLKGEGTETLRDSNDARDWQEAVKQLLTDEVRDRASRSADADSTMLATLHSSIELFQNNSDMVPGTRQFDSELAEKFVQLAKPYELRVEGKLHGYTIPVQPLVDQIRNQLVAARAVAAAQAAAATPPAQGKAAPAQQRQAGTLAPPPQSGPQRGIESRAGNASEEEDFSVLFGTLGLPSTFRI